MAVPCRDLHCNFELHYKLVDGIGVCWSSSKVRVRPSWGIILKGGSVLPESWTTCLQHVSLKLMLRFTMLFQYVCSFMLCSFTTNRKASSKNQKASYENRKEGLLWRYRRQKVLALYVPKSPKNGAASLMEYLELHLGLPWLCLGFPEMCL